MYSYIHHQKMFGFEFYLIFSNKTQIFWFSTQNTHVWGFYLKKKAYNLSFGQETINWFNGRLDLSLLVGKMCISTYNYLKTGFRPIIYSNGRVGINDARKSINTTRKSINTARKSFKEARINYNSHAASKTYFLLLYACVLRMVK